MFAVISFSAASNRSPTQVHPTVSENIGEDVASVERIIETTIASQDVEANPEVGSCYILYYNSQSLVGIMLDIILSQSTLRFGHISI